MYAGIHMFHDDLLAILEGGNGQNVSFLSYRSDLPPKNHYFAHFDNDAAMVRPLCQYKKFPHDAYWQLCIMGIGK